jgi:pyruvate kinase
VELTTCANCHCAILVDLLGSRRRTCSVCERHVKMARVSTAAHDTRSDDQRRARPESVQKQLFEVSSTIDNGG